MDIKDINLEETIDDEFMGRCESKMYQVIDYIQDTYRPVRLEADREIMFSIRILTW